MDTIQIRRSGIEQLINKEREITFARLKEAFPDVSDMTLRTDLKKLDEENRIVRIHGGAKSIETVIGTDDFLGRRNVRNVEAKKIIAKKAAALIEPNRAVFLDSGSTTTMLAELMPDEPRLIVTSSISCLIELSKLTQPKVVVPGGNLNRYSMSICGITGIQELSSMSFDDAFIGVTTYHSDSGFACNVQEECILKQTVLRHARRKIALMDSSKLEKHSTFSICGLREMDMIISDGQLPKEFVSECEKNKVQIL